MSLPQRFLRSVWAKQPHSQFNMVAVKNWETGAWNDYQVNARLPELPTTTDLYFAPNAYAKPQRRKVHCLPGRWLYADLDEVDPRGLELKPTVAWETSPGRWQALWLLARPLKPDTLGKLNQKLTYAVGADRGGWSLTKVLRVPGSISTKHGTKHRVKLLWSNGPTYEAAELYRSVKQVETPADVAGKLPDLVLPKASWRTIYRKHRSLLPTSVKKMLNAEDSDGQDRSAVLWKLQRELLEHGVPPEHVFVLVKETPWNKYKGQARESNQLWTEIQRAVKSKDVKKLSNSKTKRSRNSKGDSISDTKQEGRTRRTRSLEAFMGQEIRKPSWMIEGIWSESAHGVIAGPPKTYKSVLSTDMAVSVASGTKFLNHFPIPQQGPVLLIQNENDEGEVHDRFARILHSRGLMGSASVRNGTLTYLRDNLPPVHILDSDFDLTDPSDIKYLRRECRKHKPVLIILDPLYLLAPGVDENSAHEMTPVLERLLRIKQNYNAGTLLIHHFKKHNEQNPTRSLAERISGTGVFGRWYESALLLERPDDSEPDIKMVPVHRGHPTGGVIWARFDLGTEYDHNYTVEVENSKEKARDEYEALREFVNEKGVVTFRMLEDEMGLNRKAAERRIGQMGLKTKKKKIDGRVQLVVTSSNGRGRE